MHTHTLTHTQMHCTSILCIFVFHGKNRLQKVVWRAIFLGFHFEKPKICTVQIISLKFTNGFLLVLQFKAGGGELRTGFYGTYTHTLTHTLTHTDTLTHTHTHTHTHKHKHTHKFIYIPCLRWPNAKAPCIVEKTFTT